MKLIRTLLVVPFTLVVCVACSSEQSGSNPPEAPSAPEVSEAPESSAVVLEVEPVSGNPSGITPMDIVKGMPARPPAPPNPNPAVTSSTVVGSKPDLRQILRSSAGYIELTELPSVPVAPGDGPRGPDGKVIDPKTLLKQLKERQAAKAPDAPGPLSAPQAAPIPTKAPVSVPSVRSLDPSEAPQFPGRDPAKGKSE